MFLSPLLLCVCHHAILLSPLFNLCCVTVGGLFVESALWVHCVCFYLWMASMRSNTKVVWVRTACHQRWLHLDIILSSFTVHSVSRIASFPHRYSNSDCGIRHGRGTDAGVEAPPRGLAGQCAQVTRTLFRHHPTGTRP